MIDPDVFQEPHHTHHAVTNWLYANGFLELFEGSLRLSDKAFFFLIVTIGVVAWALVP